MEPIAVLIERLQTIAREAQDPTDISDFEPDSADAIVGRQHRVSISNSHLTSVVAALSTLPPVAALEGGTANHSPSGHGSIQLESVAHWLLAQARLFPAEQCVARLLDAIGKNESPILEVVPIWGISPKSEIDLGEDIKIVPIDSLPQSRLKDLFVGKRRHRFSFDIANSSPRPGAAIVRNTVHGPLYETADSAAATERRWMTTLALEMLSSPGETRKRDIMGQVKKFMSPPKRNDETSGLFFQAQELAPVVALRTKHPIFPLGHWYQRPIDLPLVGPVAGYSGPTNDHPFYIAIAPTDYPVQEIETLVRSFRSLSMTTRSRLRTPLRRLNDGRRQLAHHTLEGAALDIGVAAEALLTQDRDGDAPISYLLRTRGTLLLAGSAEERRRNYDVLKKLYKVRSKVAHEGAIIDRSSSPIAGNPRVRKAHDDIAAGEDICREMILKIIQLGEFPSWDSLVLGC